MVSVAVVPGRLPMLSTRVGARSPALTTASGKAFLAFCSDERVVDHVSGHLRGRDADRFRTELDEVRESSVALDRGVAYPGIVAVASPLISSDRVVLGAISIAGPSGSMDADSVAPLVYAAGATLSRRLAAA
jgi:DNA-binding IclR family transcriptional regulator